MYITPHTRRESKRKWLKALYVAESIYPDA